MTYTQLKMIERIVVSNYKILDGRQYGELMEQLISSLEALYPNETRLSFIGIIINFQMGVNYGY